MNMDKRKQALRVWLVAWVVLGSLALLVVASFAQEGTGGVANDSGQAFLPLVARMKPATTLPFADGFGPLMSPDWVEYPYAGDDWRQDEGLGIYWYNYESDDTPRDEWWALSMYQGPGSDQWTDYEIVALLKSAQAGSRKGGLNGIWFRGSYEPDGRVGGYYVHLKRRTDQVDLWRLNPGARDLGNAQLVREVTYAPGIGTKWYNLRVRVQGSNIQVSVKESTEPPSSYRLVINWTDPMGAYGQGTVGLSAYKSRAVYDSIQVTELPSTSQ
jgi:hypothetical protein